MKLFVIHDSAGNIVGRYMVTDDLQADTYRNRVDIDNEDYASRPEQWAEINIGTKEIRPKPGEVDPTSKGRRARTTETR